jgi:3-oxoacyl-[acyl-carrier protein] reductase
MNILITGGASGLGEAVTRFLAKDRQNSIYFTYHTASGQADLLQKELPNTRGIHCDFGSPDSLQALLKQMETLNLEVLINNAFTGFEKKHFHKIPSDNFSRGFERNVVPVIKITQTALLQFRKAKFGKIITVLSAAILNRPLIGWSEYVAQKNYLLSLSKSWAIENAGFNISSNCVSPAFMQTNLTNDTDERIVEEMINAHPLKKLLSPVEVAESIAFLINSSQQINGTNLIINAASDVI